MARGQRAHLIPPYNEKLQVESVAGVPGPLLYGPPGSIYWLQMVQVSLSDITYSEA